MGVGLHAGFLARYRVDEVHKVGRQVSKPRCSCRPREQKCSHVTGTKNTFRRSMRSFGSFCTSSSSVGRTHCDDTVVALFTWLPRAACLMALRFDRTTGMRVK